jgi:alanyl-tRNA synthetase
MKLKSIRATFLDFFAKNGHTIVPSSSLVPQNDPTLMFTAAGMVQFKNYFTGAEKPAYTQAVSSQKCVRAGGKHNDLENVGFTARHHTFFEMLGNFSFGDYFKEQAIQLAWQCLTKEFGINKDKLYITVYHTDDEAYNIWKKTTGFGDDKLLRIATSDNFWAMGEVGPCGPCSEIFYDHGDKLSGGLPGTPDEGGDRYVEIWNLVFMQFEDQLGGKRINLPKPSIDTGMGLERVSAVLQGTHHNYEIDLFKELIDDSQRLFNHKEMINSHRVIADHIRAISFLIADGVMPSNEGRGYVLRRIMRRSMRHAYQMGATEPQLFKIIPTLVGLMGDDYPELHRASPLITSTLQSEEERFLGMLDKGIKILDEHTHGLQAGGVLDGKTAFKLYDTFGFPLDLTSDVLKSRNISVDNAGFDAEMQVQKKRARAAWVGSGEKATNEVWFELLGQIGATEFLGHQANEAEAIVKAIIKEGVTVESVQDGEAIVVLNQTPFYGESGGQVGDTGTIDGHEVKNTQKFAGAVFGHTVQLRGELKVGQAVSVAIDVARRNKIRANHSATHLLHKALRDSLGLHVVQKGSLVAPDRLRFDFSHNKGMTSDELTEVELKVNQQIEQNHPVETQLMTPEKAVAAGAMALFGEKYGDEVRVVSMGASKELCGGTHVSATGDIGFCKIISEGSVASGIRRIEALTGEAILEYQKQEQLQQQMALEQEEKKKQEKQLSDARIAAALKKEPISSMTNPQSGKKRTRYFFNDLPRSDFKTILERSMQKENSEVNVITFSNDDTETTLIASSVEDVSASAVVKVITASIGGKGGGNDTFAQLSTDVKDHDKLVDLLKKNLICEE